MSRISLSKNLYLDEYITETLYRQYENKPWILQGLIDPRLVKADQMLRDHFGPVTINSWWDGGDRKWSGLRSPECIEFTPLSQHTFGRASDKIFKNATAEEVRIYIKANYIQLGITCIEKNVSWVHSDIRWNQTNDLVIV